MVATFREQEDGAGYLELPRQVLVRWGAPLAVYSHRHGIFRRDGRVRESTGEGVPALRFGDPRVMALLGR